MAGRPLAERRVVRLEAILTKDDLQRLLRRFAPAVVRLGDGGELSLDDPSEVSLISERGVRVVCSAKLHWPLLGIGVPVAARSLVVMVCPVIEPQPDGEALVFKIHIEHIDVTLLPTFVDDRVTDRVNAELAKKHVELSWHFGRMLSHVFALPEALASTSAIGLEVVTGTLRITDSALAFTVTFRTNVERRTVRTAH
jgi:hypothetical protein